MQFIRAGRWIGRHVNLRIKRRCKKMSDSRNNIPEREPLGGFYEEEEKKKLDSAKDFAKG